MLLMLGCSGKVFVGSQPKSEEKRIKIRETLEESGFVKR